MTSRQRGLRRLLTIIDLTLLVVGAVIGSWVLIVVASTSMAALWYSEAARFLDS